jgi:hypothetical protein
MGLSRYFQRMLLCIRMGTARVPPPPRPVRARGKTEDSDDKKLISACDKLKLTCVWQRHIDHNSMPFLLL